MQFSVKGNVVDVINKKIFAGEVFVSQGKITKIHPLPNLQFHQFIIPGFVDAHVHIESSMLVPSEFAKLAVVHGTVGTVSDPHEIANVCGLEGVEFMIKNGNTVPFKFNFGAPSCVPATLFETAGAEIDARTVEALLQKEEIKYLSEMMNFPGVLDKDKEVMKKIEAAKKSGKPVDGHAPGLRGELARKYIDAGMSTDHECFTKEEALDKLSYGMKILIREGSAAKNFEALIDLLKDHPDEIMFCSDDKHPDSLVAGHINELCARAVAKGIGIFDVLKAACVNPVLHYKLNIGLLREGDAADFITVKDLKKFEILETYIDGTLVAKDGQTKINTKTPDIINNFKCAEKKPEEFAVKANDKKEFFVIEALDGQLITNKLLAKPKTEDGKIVSDTESDILKMVVVNRYRPSAPAMAFIKNFGLKKGALASSVAHDSHNIVAVGTNDEAIASAVNAVIANKGGISCMADEELILPLPIAGLMSAEDGYKVAGQYTKIDLAAKALGSTLSAPFMTLSFMALLVIPHLKLSDRGLFDGDKFQFMP